MAIDYVALQTVVETLLAAFGELATLRRATDGAPPDADKPWEPGATSNSDTSVNAVFLDYDVRRIDGTHVQRGDQRCLIQAKGLAITPDPSRDSIIRADSTKWRIVGPVRKLDPAGTALLYELQVRKT